MSAKNVCTRCYSIKKTFLNIFERRKKEEEVVKKIFLDIAVFLKKKIHCHIDYKENTFNFKM